MRVETENVGDLKTVTLKSTATNDAAWVGGYFAYGGSKAEQSCACWPSSRSRRSNSTGTSRPGRPTTRA